MSTQAYQSLAACYDALNSGADYDAWAAYLDAAIRPVAGHGGRILDLACGTGSMLIRLLRLGYHVTGVDRSAEVLAEAKRKASDEDFCPLLLCQDMREFQVYGGRRAEGTEFDAVICCLDSVNYLTGVGDLAHCFARVRAHLKPGGLFLFDVNTPYQFEHVYADRAYLLEADGVFCAWQNDYNPKTRKCRFDLSLFFEQPDGTYLRADEVQHERCYPLRSVERVLADAGFTLRSVTSDFAGTPVSDTDCRAFFCAIANG